MHPFGAYWAPRRTRRELLGSAVAFSFGLGAFSRPLWAGGGSLLDYLKQRDDLLPRSRRLWIKAIKLRFGGAALDLETPGRPELAAAKSILSAAIFMRVSPEDAAQGAWDGWRSVLNQVPPPIAIHYQVLSFEGRKPRGRPIDLALSFPDFYNDEIAPDLVAWWIQALKEDRFHEELRNETIEALARTRVKMRPLLVDRLRLLARLDKDLKEAQGRRRKEIRKNLRSLEADLRRAFFKVSRRPEVLEAKRRPYDRLLMALEDFGVSPSDEDRTLDPGPVEAAPPPPHSPKAKRSKRRSPRTEPSVAPPKKEVEPAVLKAPEPKPLPPRQKASPAPDPERQKRRSERASKKRQGGIRARLERSIRPWIGTPYRWGLARRGVGTDCSGFTRALFLEAFDLRLPRVSRDQFRLGRPIAQRNLRPGDLVFFDFKDSGRVTHVGIYVGGGEFAHASFSRGVVKDQLGARWCRRAYVGARRVLLA